MSYTPQQIKTIEGTLTNFLNWSNINYPANGSKYRIYQTVDGYILDADIYCHPTSAPGGGAQLAINPYPTGWEFDTSKMPTSGGRIFGLGHFLDASAGWSQAGVWILSISGAQNFLGASYINGGASTPPVTPSAPLSIAGSDSIMAWIRGLPVRRI